MKPKPPVRKRTRGRSKRRRGPVMIRVQEVHCKDCKRKFELMPAGSAIFCIWCRNSNIQIVERERRETPAERKQRELEMNARFIDAGMRLISSLFGFAPPPPNGHPPRSPHSQPASALEAELLKTGYRKLAEKYHPDKGGDPEKMKELNRLKERLGL